MMLTRLQRSSGSLCHRHRPQQLLLVSSWRCCSSFSSRDRLNNNKIHNHRHSSYYFQDARLRFNATNNNNIQHFSPHRSYASTTILKSDNSGDSAAPLRRRRRKKSAGADQTADTNNNTAATVTAQSAADGAFFSPKDSKTGNLLTSDEYLQLASLSPWVPCPDVVAKRVFEIAATDSNSNTNSDVHVDLGCGDGRLNFMAVDVPSNGIMKSWGVDVDENILDKCRERLGKRYVPSHEQQQEEEERLEFVQADLIQVIERQKELYQQQLLSNHDSTKLSSTNVEISSNEYHQESSSQSITVKISNSTIITMYFVDNALQQIQPYLSSILGGKKNVRVITIGYEMPNKDGWSASWVERVLGLTIFRYDMEHVSRFPSDWSLDGDEDGEDDNDDVSVSKATQSIQGLEGDNTDDHDVEEFLRRKREEDIEELNRGLTIHHDEELENFAHARAKQQGLNAIPGSAPILNEEDEDVWDDFDETEDPMELMKETQRRIMEERKASRGKMMAGVKGDKKKKKLSTSTDISSMKKPTWKKP